MLNFLRESRKVLSIHKKICVVLGNESCDLDSAVSAISLAHYYSKFPESIPTNDVITAVLPILNTSRIDFSLKTEVVYYFKKHHIDANILTFIDDLGNTTLENAKIILVDHHVSPFNNSVIEVFDHRPFDISSKLKESCIKHLDGVGSCCTLIGNLILNAVDDYTDFEQTLKLLYGGIILDTVNFSSEANRFKELDLYVVQTIEKKFKITNVQEFRHHLFEELVTARNNVDMLDSYQILFKDLKEIFNKNGTRKISFPGFPLLVEDYIKLPNSEENVQLFAKNQCCSLIVLIGMKIKNQRFERDIGFINICDEELFAGVCDAVVKSSIMNLEEYKKNTFLNGRFFKQHNLSITRKQVIPLVKSVLEENGC